MAQGDWTKEEAQATIDAVDEVMKGMSKKKSIDFIGHFNDIFLFLNTAKEHAPDKKE